MSASRYTPDPRRSPDFYSSVPTKRFLAWLIDAAVILALCILLGPFTGFIGWLLWPFFWLTVSLGYRTLTLGNRSATLGMRMMAIELRDMRGERLDLGQGFAHSLGYTLCMASFIAQIVSIVMMLGTERRQSLPDMVLGTVMINRR